MRNEMPYYSEDLRLVDRVVKLELALRQVVNGARSLENGEENPIEAAQDIQHICYAALSETEPLPSIWKIWRGDHGSATPGG